MMEPEYSNIDANKVYHKDQPEESGYAVYDCDGDFTVFSWVYGGMEKFEGVYDTLDEAIEDAESWT